MERVLPEGFGSDLVEGLHVDEALDEAFLVHLHHMRGDAAEGVACVYALLYHALTYVLDSCEGCSAGTGLDGEALLEVTAVDDDLGCGLREQYVPWVLGVTDGT